MPGSDQALRSLSGWTPAVVLALSLLGSSTSLVGQQAQDDAATSGERGRTPAAVMSYRGAPWLERSTREAEENPGAVIDKLALEEGQVVADLGCGSGYFTRRMAREVGETGVVYGVDIQPQMLELLRQTAADAGLTNIVPILGTENDPKLPAGKLDWILLVDVYHEFQQPEAMLAKMREALAANGRIALLEYRLLGNTARHIKLDHRMSVEQVLAEWLPAGFELVKIDEELPAQHLFVFRKAE